MKIKVKDIGIGACTQYFFDDIVDTKNFDLNNMKIKRKVIQKCTTLDL